MKIIGMTPSYNDAMHIHAFFASLDKIDPKIDYHLFATNNCTDKTPAMVDDYLKTRAGEHKRFSLPKDFMTAMDEPYAGVGIARQFLLKRARELMEEDESYTHALCLDTDIYIDTYDALTKITEWRADIIGGSYMRLFPEGQFLATRFHMYKETDTQLKKEIFYDLCVPFVTSGGFLCLSRKAVLDERLRFFPIWKTLANGHVNDDTSEDFGFCLLAHKFGYETYVDGTIRLSHFLCTKERGFIMKESGRYVDFKY